MLGTQLQRLPPKFLPSKSILVTRGDKHVKKHVTIKYAKFNDTGMYMLQLGDKKRMTKST